MKIVRGRWKHPKIKTGPAPVISHLISFAMGGVGGGYMKSSNSVYVMGAGDPAENYDWGFLIAHEINHWAHEHEAEVPGELSEELANYGLEEPKNV